MTDSAGDFSPDEIVLTRMAVEMTSRTSTSAQLVTFRAHRR